ncbi:hypothetical protein [Clostridium sp. 001]|uniref:hypothetical protein n=1 Tax=Clostridium sp. 001 TaxID=1970093 RepID=UPI001C2BD89A|nr:hypothetical protein [Clostridium sp. 001]QXE19516.1 hypothetical protein B5S50_12175 [Clostridium sp. 001]
MSKRQENKFVISEQEPQKCEYCGKIAELRPYGKNGANICFKCAMKDEEEAKKQFGKILDDADEVVVVKTNVLN